MTGSTAGYTRCTETFHAGGFKILDEDCIGRYVIIRREGRAVHGNEIIPYEVRIYLVPNLLTDATIILAPEPKDPTWKADNLIQHLDTRSTCQDSAFNPILNWNGVYADDSGVTRAPYSSCFVTTDAQLSENYHKFVLTIRLDKRASIYGFTLVQETG